jgi:hypothetical protein
MNSGALLNLVDFTRGFIFPISSLLQRPIEADGTFYMAGMYAAAAIPALIRMEDNRSLTFFRIRDENVDGADFHTSVTALALVTKDNRPAGSGDIRQSIDFLLGHENLL